MQNDYGVAGFTPLLSKNKVNGVVLQPQGDWCLTGSPCPPKTGAESVCHCHNPDSYATGAANSKAVQVYYNGGVSRWFMAFNEQIHSEDNQGSNSSDNSSDNWRILWARSEDGKTWTVDPQILFRSVSETSTDYCGTGLLVTDMFLDNGHFYMTFTDVGTSAVYLVRSQIATPYGTNPGYGTWKIAVRPLKNGQWDWKDLELGKQLNFVTLQAANILPSRMTNPGFTVKQSDIGRVFTSATPNSASRYIALTSDVLSGQPVLQVWSTDSLNKPFQYESDVDLSAVSIGGNGLEIAFTQYSDNLPSTPRLIAGQLDFWIVQNLTNPDVPGDLTPRISVSRFTARLRGGIYGQ